MTNQELAAKYNLSIRPFRYHHALKSAKGFICFASEHNEAEIAQLEKFEAEAEQKGKKVDSIRCNFLLSALAELAHGDRLKALNFWMEYHGFTALFEADKLQPLEAQRWTNEYYPAMMALYERDSIVEDFKQYDFLLSESLVF